MRGWRSSGLKTADAAIMAKPGYFGGLFVMTDGTNAATAVAYDNATTNTGTELAKLVVPGATLFAQEVPPAPGVYCSNGIYVDMTVGGGGSMSYFVWYFPE